MRPTPGDVLTAGVGALQKTVASTRHFALDSEPSYLDSSLTSKQNPTVDAHHFRMQREESERQTNAPRDHLALGRIQGREIETCAGGMRQPLVMSCLAPPNPETGCRDCQLVRRRPHGDTP